ncbi:MAG TPA: hypothetical protein VLU43_00880 [Anaeromyxobacteraceae bacterium]|nr:hypothetical protein [Anaeromyxobacteraceae bacterium]
MGRFTRPLAAMLTLLPAAARGEPPDAKASGAWKPAAYLDAYYQSGTSGYLVPTVFLDREPWHLEARYNYEDFDTASLFVGYGFSFGGEENYLTLRPMVGGLFGNVNGVAPGLEVDARWKRLTYWLESEYVFDFKDSSSNYLYTWSELYFNVLDWLWIGGSLERLKVVKSPTEVDVGPMVGFGKPGSPGWSLSFYAYGLTRSDPQFLATLAVQF